jgi:hypothetical protein
VLFDRRRRRMALQRLDVSGDRDGLNVFEVLIPGAFDKNWSLESLGRNNGKFGVVFN